jgi:hypothetical protein
LSARAGRIGLAFLGVDATGTVDPLGLIDGVEPLVQLGVAPPLQTNQKSIDFFGNSKIAA